MAVSPSTPPWPPLLPPQVIGATTLDEHRKYIERDAALERRFQPVLVDEPSQEATLAILLGLKERYERHHRCAYTEEALAAAVALSAKYIADRFLPDKVRGGGLRLGGEGDEARAGGAWRRV